MIKKGLLISIILVIAVIAGILANRAYTGNKAADTTSLQTATVERGSLTSSLSSSGNTRSGQSATIAWQTSGKANAVTLQPGDFIKEDQVLATLDPSTLSTEVIKAKQTLIDAQQTLDDLLNSKLQQAQAMQTLEDAQETLDDLKQAAAEKASQAQLTLADAQEALEDAQLNRDKMNYPHSTDKLVIEKAQTDYLLAKDAYKEALREYNRMAHKSLTNPERVQALNRLVTAEQVMETAFATYNWYLQNYTAIDIAQADAELAVAKANLESAQAEWDRLKNGTSSAEIAMAEATLADAQREWERVKDGVSAEDIAAAQAAVDAAQATLDQAQLRAPFAGTITELDVKTGDLVNSGDVAARIDDLSSLYVDLEISEYDLINLKVGQHATLEFDAIPDKQYNGEVVEIGMIGTVSNGVVNYPVTIRITKADENILPGMTATATITTAEVENSLLVPNKAIHTSSGQQTVTVLFEGQQFSIPITVGLVGDSQSEVVSDQLREGDVVVLLGSNSTSTSTNRQGDRIFIESGGFEGPPPGIP